MSKKTPFIPLLSGILACAFLAAGCDRMLPTELRKKTGYPVSGIDAEAAGLMSADTASSAARRIRAAVLPRPALTAWKNADDAFIAANLDTVLSETAMLIGNPQAEDTVYAFFPATTGGTSEMTFYLSWMLSPANLDATVDMAVFDANGATVRPVSSAMSLELAAACTQSIETGGQPASVPKIRGRYVFSFQPAQGRLLIRFILSKPQAVGTLQLAVLHGYGSGI